VGVATRLLAVLGLVLALLLCGCTYNHEEPGLFRVRSPSPAPAPTASDAARLPRAASSRTDLPVAGERVRTTSEGARVTARLAVHALRRIPGGTVLDWSVTPLAMPGGVRGNGLPGQTDLGLAQSRAADVSIWLLDPDRQQAYRSVTHKSRRKYNRCLCSPLWSAQPEFQLGATRLLQAVFPVLPARVDFVDVYLANLAPIAHVPVTPVGLVPTAVGRVDLTRPSDDPGPTSRPVSFHHSSPQALRRSSITVDRVVASSGWTAMEWSLTSLNDQAEYRSEPLGPPITAQPSPEVERVTGNPANGPTLRAAGSDGPQLSPSWMTTHNTGRPAYECLCSDIGLWARSLSADGGTAQVVGLYPALPAGTRAVEVSLPGVSVARVPVTRAPDAARRLGPPVSRTVRTWVYSDDVPPQGWPAEEWPSPLPDEWQLPDYRSFVEDIVPLPPAP
jgi:hypothetical protein